MADSLTEQAQTMQTTLGAMLDAIESGEMDASAALTNRLEGGLVVLSALLGDSDALAALTEDRG